MINIIKAEIFKNFKSVYFRISFFGGCILIAAVMLFLPELSKIAEYPVKDASTFMKVLPFLFIGASIALIVMFPMFTDIFKYDTYKNNSQAILLLPAAKFAAGAVMLLVYALVFMISMSAVLMRIGSGEENLINTVLECNIRFLGAIPCYLALIASVQFLTVAVKNEIAAVVVYYFAISQLFTGELIIRNILSDTLGITPHLTPLGELFSLGENKFSFIQIAISSAVGIIYTAVIYKVTSNLYKKRVFS